MNRTVRRCASRTRRLQLLAASCAGLFGWSSAGSMALADLNITTSQTYAGANVNGTLNVNAAGNPLLTITSANNLTAAKNAVDVIVGNANLGRITLSSGGILVNSGIVDIAQDTGSTGVVTVGGTNSRWTSTGLVVVGGHGVGTLTVNAGGRVESDDGFYVGRYVESVGSVFTVNGSNAVADGHRLYVGVRGDATMSITNGGTVNIADNFSAIAYYDDSISSVTVGGGTGTSTWNNASNLFIGGNSTAAGGTGTLTVNAGGLVNVTGANSTKLWDAGTLTIDGGTFNTTSLDRSVGTLNLRNGTLKINGGDYVQASTLLTVAGNAVGKNPLLHLSGAGTTSTIEAVIIGQTGNTQNGQLLIDAGRVLNVTGTGLLTNISPNNVYRGQSYIGFNSGSTGSATVSGAGSKWISLSNMNVGYQGTGSLSIQNGGEVSSYSSFLGNNGGNGSVTVTGSGSKWTNSSALYIGYGGLATGLIDNGGEVLNTTGYIASASSSTASVSVTGNGSKWTNSNGLYIGGYDSVAGGTATLSITNSGLVSVTGTTKLWNAGTLTIDGGTLNTTNFDRTLGTVNHHDGTLKINGGAYTQATGALIIAGNAAGKFPMLYLSGTGATTGIQAVVVGQTGNTQNGTLFLDAGRVVNNAGDDTLLTTIGGTNVFKGRVYIGLNSGSTGSVTVAGTGTQWTNSGGLYVGYSGSAFFIAQSGGEVTSAFGTIGFNATSTATAIINGTGTKWTAGSSLDVGMSGTGNLFVQDAALVTSAAGNIGYNGGSTGSTATIDGLGSQWTMTGGLYVGRGGQGTLNVQAGGVVSNTFAHIGSSGSSTGVATVTGTGSQWNLSQNLFVGAAGNGTLNIQNGGQVTNTNGYMCFNAGSTSTVTVTGAGSQWTNTTGLYIGGNAGSSSGGTAALSITNSGLVSVATTTKLWNAGTLTIDGGTLNTTNFDRTLGTANHYDGTLRVNGGSYTQTLGPLIVAGNAVGKNPLFHLSGNGTTTGVEALVIGKTGNTQDASLRIEAGRVLNIAGNNTVAATLDGTEVRRGNSYLGLNAGSTGSATVTGIGSAWTNVERLHVGYGGTGQLNVEAGATVTSSMGFISVNNGSTGIAAISGSGSKWTTSQYLFVGYNGTGTLNTTAGGEVATPEMYLGIFSAGSGTATVSGAGSVWNISSALYLGGNSLAAGGNGSLAITNAGQVNVTGTTKLWNAATLTIDGGSLNTTSFDRTFGTVNHHDGTLKVNGGAYTQTTGALVIAANAAGKNPLLQLSGNGTTTGIEAVVLGKIGNHQNGQLLIDAGRVVNNTGSGMLTTIDGFFVFRGQSLIGYFVNSTGSATVTGIGSKWTNTNDFVVGGAGNGTLNILAGGEVTNSSGVIAYNPSSTSSATVNGANSKWTNTGNIYVGAFGAGTLNIQSGAEVRNSYGFISQYSGSLSSATVTGSGSHWINNSDLYIGGSSSASGGMGTLNISNSGQVSVTGLTKLWNAATISMNGGTLQTGSLEAASTTAKILLTGNANIIEITGGASSFGGTVEGTGGLSKAGSGTLTFTAANTYAGGTTINAGTLQVGPGGTVGNGNVTNNAMFDVARSGLTTAAIDGATGTTTVTAAGASLTANHIRQATLNIGAGNTVTVATNGGDTGTSVLTNLSINATGKLDLTNNDLIVDNGNLTTLTAKLASGLDITGSYGAGPGINGITSSTFANDPNFNTVLGIASNADLGYATFSGQTIDANDVLIKYTYFGDADLNGVVDGATDFDLYITGLTSGGSLGGWLYGDFDYNGTVDSATDFDLYITGFSSQGGPLLTGGGSGNLVQAVPEPSTLVLGALGGIGLAAHGLRRRRSMKQVI